MPLRTTMLALVLALAGASVATAAPARSTDAKAWCAAVIRINTKYGSMKNRTYDPLAWTKRSVRKGVTDEALREKAQLLAITPGEIKTAQAHELVYLANVKSANYSLNAPRGPYTGADVEQLAKFQRTKCGIKGI